MSEICSTCKKPKVRSVVVSSVVGHICPECGWMEGQTLPTVEPAVQREAPIGVGPVPATHIPCISVTETAKPIPGLVSSLTDVVALGQCAFCPKQAFHELHLCNDHFAAWPTSIKLPPTAELREALRFTPNDIQGVLIQVDGKGTNLARSRELAEALSLAGRIRMGIDRRAALAQADRSGA